MVKVGRKIITKVNVAKNTIHLYIVMMVKIIVPLAVMPYLARILSTDQYAAYSYLRACMTFVNLVMDYGFIYSATKKIADAADDKETMNGIVSAVSFAKVLLMVLCLTIIAILTLNAEKIKDYFAFSINMTLATCLLNVLPDYLFRGLEKMRFLSSRMVVSRVVTTLLLFVVVRSERDFMKVAYLEILCAIIAVFMTIVWLVKEKYRIVTKKIVSKAIAYLREGRDYFLITVAPSAYGALNTIFIGNELSALEVIYWNTAWNVISAVLNMYNPIIHGIYPHMVKKKDFRLLRKALLVLMPLICVGTVAVAILSKWIFLVLGGNDYVAGYWCLIALSAVLIFAFPAMILGPPVLGAMGKENEMCLATVGSAAFHVASLVILILTNRFTLLSVCILRCVTEFVGLAWRTHFVYRNRKIFAEKA